MLVEALEVVDVGAVQNDHLFGVHIDRTYSTLILCHIEAHKDGLFGIVDSGCMIEIVFILHYPLNQALHFVLNDLDAVSLVLSAAGSIVKAFYRF